jgi:uncharacterized protein DUF4410
MVRDRFASLLALLVLPVLPEVAPLTLLFEPLPPQSPVSGPVIYISDFELQAVSPKLRPADVKTQPQSDEPSEQAKRIVSSLKLDLIEALKKAGFSVQSFPQQSGRPDNGVLIRGVFTEPDEYNRVRRVLLGSGSPSPKFVLYVGASNLARPDQPLYQLVPFNAPGFPIETRFGPLITVNSYLPVTSFDLPRRPSDDDLKRIAGDITARLSSLIAANPALRQ